MLVAQVSVLDVADEHQGSIFFQRQSEPLESIRQRL